jgi:sugar phosphate isomerase/epimerase
MAEDWRKLMDLGIIHFMAFPIIRDEGPILPTAAKIAQDDFFDVLEVRRSEHPEVMAGLRQIAEQSKLKLGLGAQPGLLLNKLSLNDEDEAGRRAAVDEVKLSVDAAYELGCTICACLSGPDAEESKRDHAMDLLVASLVELCEYSRSKAGDGEPVWISLEQFDDAIDKRCLMGPSARAAELAERVKAQVENFGLTIDLSHLPLLGETPQECLTAVIDHLIHVHVGNCLMQDEEHPGYGDKHPRFGYPGSESDVGELARFMETLIYSGYFERDLPSEKPIVSFEVAPMPGEDPDLVIASSKRAFNAAWAMI